MSSRPHAEVVLVLTLVSRSSGSGKGSGDISIAFLIIAWNSPWSDLLWNVASRFRRSKVV